MQRFECLQLDITGEKTKSLMDALDVYFFKETMAGDGGVRLSKQMSLDVVPQVCTCLFACCTPGG